MPGLADVKELVIVLRYDAKQLIGVIRRRFRRRMPQRFAGKHLIFRVRLRFVVICAFLRAPHLGMCHDGPHLGQCSSLVLSIVVCDAGDPGMNIGPT